MNRSRPRSIAEIRLDDPSVTGHAGLLLVKELAEQHRLVERLDLAIDGVHPFKRRRRGLSGGELLVRLAESMLVGADHLAHLQVLRQDQAGAVLRAVEQVPAPETASLLLPRFWQRQCEAAVKVMAGIGNEVDRRGGLEVGEPVTLDLDSTTTEVYGRGKEGCAYNYEGKLSYGSEVCTWAERRRPLAVGLRAGNDHDHATAPKLLRRGLSALPQGHGPVHARTDSGFFSTAFMTACRRGCVTFSISLPRNSRLQYLRRHVAPNSWKPAIEMHGAEVAEVSGGYSPGGWRHEPVRLLVRRVRVSATDLQGSPRSRRRRSVPKGQLKLVLRGRIEHTYAYSFIVTDLPGEADAIEYLHRLRAQIEERIKDLKLGCGLRHLPLQRKRANQAWQTAAVIASSLVSLLSAIEVHRAQAESARRTDPQAEVEEVIAGRNHNTPFIRRWLINLPARVLHSARRRYLRMPPSWPPAIHLQALYSHLLALPSG